MKEILIPTYTKEEAEGEAKAQEKTLLREMLYASTSGMIQISDIITNIHKRLKTYLQNLNN